MYKKIVVGLLILSFFNYLTGCYTSDILPGEKVYRTSEKIIGVVLTNGNEITFDDNGGSYHIENSFIEGTSVDNRRILIFLDNIKELRRTRIPSVDIEYIDTNKITEIVSNEKRLYKFSREGGTYDGLVNVISGKTENGIPIRFKPNQILEIHLDSPDIISKKEITINDSLFILQIVLKNNNRLITFNKDGAKYYPQKAVVSGYTSEKQSVKYPIQINPSEISYAKIKRIDAAKTALASLGVVAVMVIAFYLVAGLSWKPKLVGDGFLN